MLLKHKEQPKFTLEELVIPALPEKIQRLQKTI